MKTDFNWKIIARIFGSLILFEVIFLCIALIVAFIYRENAYIHFIYAIIVGVSLGALLVYLGRNATEGIGKREGSLIVTFIWIVFSFIGLLPYWFGNYIPSITDGFFETISGFTTTGASILNNIEEMPYSILFWRSLTHWIGGLGIIVMSLALLPVFGANGTQLFAAEAAGPTKDKIHPRIGGTAKRLFLVYLTLTGLETIALKVAGMSIFDAICQSFATIATGGFSTKQASIAHWNSASIEYIIITFMILSGINFSLFYFGFKNKFKKVFENDELKHFLIVLFSFAFLIFAFNTISTNTFKLTQLSENWRNALFNVSSLMTTTGFGTVDYMQWAPFTWVILLTAMVFGASAGSTSGAIKMVRIVIVIKYCYYEFKRIIHPNAVSPVLYNGQVVKPDIITRVLAFVLLYLATIIFGIAVATASGLNFIDAVGGVIGTLGGVGPGLGSLGPMGNYAHIPDFTKWFFSFLMLIGRLELFTVLLLFTPVFWKK